MVLFLLVSLAQKGKVAHQGGMLFRKDNSGTRGQERQEAKTGA